MRLPEDFTNRMTAQLGSKASAYFSAMGLPPCRSLRVNTLKATINTVLSSIPGLVPNGICREGFIVPDTLSPARDPLHLGGFYYMQEASAQFPAELAADALRADEPVALDLCAAPGGKSGQLAAMMNNRGLLISNEPVPKRCETLQFNLERLGVTNAMITCMKPEQLCPLLKDTCDVVLVDAPCSGEGMFRKEPEAVTAWSVEHVNACALRQKGILEEAAAAVKPGGALIYSTCTFSPEENEEQIRSFLSVHPDFLLVSSDHLYPHTSSGEGQFAACLRKEGSRAASHSAVATVPQGKPIPAWEEFRTSYFSQGLSGIPSLLPDGRVVLFPRLLPSSLKGFRIRLAGTCAGEIKGNRFIPEHGLYMRCDLPAGRNIIDLNETDFDRYIAGETIPVDPGLSGWTAVRSRGAVIGFGKADHGIMKNHFPKGLRIR